MYLLSICIPTFNRAKELQELLNTINLELNVEIIICDDGSTDNTKELINKYLCKPNIKYIFQKNSGVSSAIITTYKKATGKYLIKMDSDDLFTENGLNFILDTIIKNPNQAAFLYGVEAIKLNKKKYNLPPDGVTNFIAADFLVNGDMKQVVKREIVLHYIYEVPKGVKRIPPGLLWAKIAEDYNCLSFHYSVAIKNYIEGGITSNMLYLKTLYPGPMVELYRLLSESNAYESLKHRWRSRLLWARYSFHNKSIEIYQRWQLLVFIPGWCIYIFDKIRLKKRLLEQYLN